MRKSIFILIICFIAFLVACANNEAPSFTEDLPAFGSLGEETNVAQEVFELAATPRLHKNIGITMPHTLNPLLNTDPSLSPLFSLLFEPLVIFNEEMRPIANPAITESIVLSPQATSVTITLRANIFWEDGTPITANDIAFSIGVLTNNASVHSLYRQNIANIASYTILNSNSIVLNLHQPMGYIKYFLNFPIISAEYYGLANMNQPTAARNMHPIGNGQFRFLSHTQARHIDLVANGMAAAGAPIEQTARAIILRDAESQLFAFEQGIIDRVEASPALSGRFVAAGFVRERDFIGNEFTFLGFNFGLPEMQNLDLRRAIAHSLDVNGILAADAQLAGRTTAPINPLSWLYNQDLAGFDFDLGLAASIFDSMGYILVDNMRIRQLGPGLPPSVLQIVILVNEESESRIRIAQNLAQNLASLGVGYSLSILPFNDYLAAIEGGAYTVFVGSVQLPDAPSLGFLHSSSAGFASYQSHILDMQIDLIRLASNELTMTHAVSAFQEYILYNLPIFGIGFNVNAVFSAP